MGESLTERRLVEDEFPRDVNSCKILESKGAQYATALIGILEASANSVPAAAVIRRMRALFGITGLKARVGGLASIL